MPPDLVSLLKQAVLAATTAVVATKHVEPETVCVALSAIQTVLAMRVLQRMGR